MGERDKYIDEFLKNGHLEKDDSAKGLSDDIYDQYHRLKQPGIKLRPTEDVYCIDVATLPEGLSPEDYLKSGNAAERMIKYPNVKCQIITVYKDGKS